MAPFWQISGPGNHVRRDWKNGTNAANAQIAETIFNALCIKSEDGIHGVDLILGKRTTPIVPVVKSNLKYQGSNRPALLRSSSHTIGETAAGILIGHPTMLILLLSFHHYHPSTSKHLCGSKRSWRRDRRYLRPPKLASTKTLLY